MRRLVRIELTAAVVLLTALGLGAWLVLRRGLRPLEEMAASAATITAGDLTERVEPADDRTEVGQLGLALNTMLDGIEGSFREREATERRLRQFLSDASHELRTPLTSIQGFAELFRLHSDERPVDLPVIMRRIEQESGRMKVLVEDLLLLARLDETRPHASSRSTSRCSPPTPAATPWPRPPIAGSRWMRPPPWWSWATPTTCARRSPTWWPTP
ncbi:MAG: histidine kinase dimerization/phospho-acceptor domain-containing protein [Acidimicrobiales bacterium]